ncbi:Ig-like domain (group 2) [Frankineae bacterium MT45]|nr:Ig-like domain (group 2) [Frankineae bacterium MT45]
MKLLSGVRPRAGRGIGTAVILSVVLSLVGVGFAVPAGAADANNCPCSLFAPGDAPSGGAVDSGDRSSVELGVQFSVDAAEPITALRFYKADANVGTHVGSIWSSDGTLLAQATFTDETADGWQQVDFATPVTALPGNTYVASYFAPSGHYSETDHYFDTGLNNGILHAPGADSSSANGLYVYTPTPAFPTGTYNGANYWIDVVAGPASSSVVLNSLAVTPATASALVGATTQFHATGTYSDASTADLTSTASWSSSNPGVATVNSAGLVTAVGAGTATITATSGSVSNSATIKVTAPVTLTGVTLTGVPASLAKGLTGQLAATANYSDGTSTSITSSATWSSANPSVATVSSGGLLTAVGVGATTITVSFGGKSAIASTSVTAAVLTSLAINGVSQMRILHLQQLHAIATYSDGSKVDVTTKAAWRSSKLFTALVTCTGLVATLLFPAPVTITATYGGQSAALPITVTF